MRMMRIRRFIVLGVVAYFAMSLFVLGGEAKFGVKVTHVSKRKLGLSIKAVGAFAYNPKLNRWECVEGTNDKGADISNKPVILQPILIGKQKVPAYYEAGNMMADPCDNSYIIITDQSYAIVISTDCTGDSEGRLNKYVKSFSLPKGVNAIRAKEKAGWEVIE
jgi:hypothetical protein